MFTCTSKLDYTFRLISINHLHTQTPQQFAAVRRWAEAPPPPQVAIIPFYLVVVVLAEPHGPTFDVTPQQSLTKPASQLAATAQQTTVTDEFELAASASFR